MNPSYVCWLVPLKSCKEIIKTRKRPLLGGLILVGFWKNESFSLVGFESSPVMREPNVAMREGTCQERASGSGTCASTAGPGHGQEKSQACCQGEEGMCEGDSTVPGSLQTCAFLDSWPGAFKQCYQLPAVLCKFFIAVLASLSTFHFSDECEAIEH